VTFRDALAPTEVWAALDLRRRVFADGMGLPIAQIQDGKDDHAVHLVAVEDDGRIVSTCRLLPAGDRVKLSFMATDEDHRGQGLAQTLLALADQRARELGAERITLNAYGPVEGFYAAAGYEAVGEPFEHRELPHRHMEKRLA
jgi:predicted GNAT family N-acyltransferase